MATPDTDGTAAPVDFLQRAWATPEPHEIFRNEILGILIVPDLRPAVPEGQVLVVARQASWDEMSSLDIARFYLAGELVCDQIAIAYDPERGTSLSRFGNDSPTPHLICYPRDEISDGALLFDKGRSKATPTQLAATQARMQEQFRASGFAAELQRVLGSITLQ